jgi:hypothetical protein
MVCLKSAYASVTLPYTRHQVIMPYLIPTLLALDGVEFVVEQAVAFQSELIKDMITGQSDFTGGTFHRLTRHQD